MSGVSRKSFLGKTRELPVDQRLEGGLAAGAVAVFLGARIVRTAGQPGMFDVTVATDLGENAAGEIACLSKACLAQEVDGLRAAYAAAAVGHDFAAGRGLALALHP